MTPVDFLLVKMALAARFPFRETSGYRSVGANRLVGGAEHSQHQHWLATDVVLDIPADQVAFTQQAQRMGLLVVDEGDHLHLQPERIS